VTAEIVVVHTNGDDLPLHLHRHVRHLPSGPAEDRLIGWVGLDRQLQ
jgi:hypothetical protein